MKRLHPQREPPPDEAGKVAAYLASKRLRRLVLADFAALADPAAFWAAPEFARLYAKQADERDRLTLDNVLGRINHCPKPQLWLRWHTQVAAGRLTLAQFVKKIITTRKG